MKRRVLVSFFVCWAMSSCGDKNGVPGGILPREKMQVVLWDMISAGEFLDGYVLHKDSVNKLAANTAVYGQVFQVNHITREEFDKSFAWYREHPALMKVILDSLGKRPIPVIAPTPPVKKDSVQVKKDSLQHKILAIHRDSVQANKRSLPIKSDTLRMRRKRLISHLKEMSNRVPKNSK